MLAAIICEYNPFHAGHAYMVGEVRRALGADVTIAAVMGGIFSQRGEPYIAPPTWPTARCRPSRHPPNRTASPAAE